MSDSEGKKICNPLRCSSINSDKLQSMFAALGYYVATHPLKFITCSVIFALGLGSGVLFLEEETDSDLLYAPKNSQSWDDQRKWDAGLGAKQPASSGIMIITSDNGNNVYTPEYIQQVQDMDTKFRKLSVDTATEGYKVYDDICSHPALFTDRCEWYSVVGFHGVPPLDTIDQSLIGSLKTVNDFAVDQQTGNQVFIQRGLGGAILDENGVVQSAEALMTSYIFEASDNNNEWEKNMVDVEFAENGFFDEFKLGVTNFMSVGSFDREFARAANGDTIFVMITFTLIFVLATLFSYRSGCVYNKMMLAQAGLLSSILGIVAGTGLFVIVGYKWNAVTAIAPFLLLGIGVDDMFVLIRAFELTDPSLVVEARMRETMRDAGTAIFFTSVTDCIAFLIGATGPFQAINAFCALSAFGVVFDFAFAVTFFAACLTYQARREKAQQACCGSCTGKDVEQDVEDGGDEDAGDVVSVEKFVSSRSLPGFPGFKIRQSSIMSVHNIYEEATWANKYVKWLLQWPVVTVVFVIFAAYMGAAIYAVTVIGHGQNVTDLLPIDSYVTPFIENQEKFFDLGLPTTFVFQDTEELNILGDEVTELIDAIKADKECYVENSIDSWIDRFRKKYPSVTANDANVYDLAAGFVDTPEGRGDINAMIRKGNEAGEMRIEEFYIRVTQQSSDPGQVVYSKMAECMERFRDIVSKSSLKDSVFPIIPGEYLHAEADLIIVRTVMFNILFAIIACYVLCLIMLPSFMLANITMLCVSQILIGVLGFTHYWGLQIDTTLSILLVMTIGFAVDNVAHICHAFMHAPFEDVKERISYALNHAGVPILLGDLTTVIALTPTAFANSNIFLSFFKCIFLVMVFGFSHAVVYLPCLLYFINPAGLHKAEAVTENETKGKDTEVWTEDV